MKWVALGALIGACLLAPPPYDKPPNTDGCNQLATVECMLRDSCTGGFLIAHVWGDLQTCIDRTALICRYATELRDTGQTAEQLATCASQTTAQSCIGFFEDNPPPSCDATGAGANGTPCGAEGECSSGYCGIASDAICGTCQPKPVIGSSCGTASDCGHDFSCPKPSGSPSGTCQLWAGLGDACDEAHVCAQSLSCTTAGMCVQAPTAGEACSTGSPSCDGSRGLHCIAQKCVDDIQAHPGEPCGAVAGGIATCIADGACIRANATDKAGICMAPALDGGACSDDPTIGPPCLDPANCVAGVCTVRDPRQCKTH